ncbi:MAG TPA: hypothetical protein VMW27_26120 [Thermoanaerobaculia bacterium]|nr:hypothetical protein [Thermoanaerobaculia bacterium]
MQAGDEALARRLPLLLLGVVGAAALLYTLTRAAVLSFTHDESLTYLHYVLEPLDVTLESSGFSPANNHLLNSLLMRAGAWLVGPREIALRFHSWLGHVLYVSAAFLLARRLRSPAVAFGTFVLLVANPFLLDFFSLARGYGLGLGFTLMGLHELIGFFEQSPPRVWRALLAFALLGCAVLCNFSFLNVYLAAGVVFFVLAVRSPGVRFRAAGAVTALSALLVYWAASTLLELREWGELYYGGQSGFFADTVQSLVRSSLYDRSWTDFLVLPLSVLAVGCFAASVLSLWKGGGQAGRITAGIALVAVFGILLQHYLFGVRFVLDRAALFFLPLFFFTLGAAVDGKRRARVASFGGAALVLLGHTLGCANFTHTLAWRFDADTRRMLDDLVAWESAQGEPPGTIKRMGVNWIFEPAVNFYIQSRGLTWLRRVDRKSVRGSYDYYFYAPTDEVLVARKKLQRIASYPVTGNVLAVRDVRRVHQGSGTSDSGTLQPSSTGRHATLPDWQSAPPSF